MHTNKLYPRLQLILLIGFTPALLSCQHVTIKNRQPCFVNGIISQGATCANTVTDHTTWQISTQQVLDILEARPVNGNIPAHPPGVFQSADDYGGETTELDIACRLLGDDCSYELQQMIESRKQMLDRARAMMNPEVTHGLEDLHHQRDIDTSADRTGVAAWSEPSAAEVGTEKDSGN
jgi:hypothetical protein